MFQRLVLLSAMISAFALGDVSPSCGELLFVERGPTSNAIPIPSFDNELGILRGVRVDYALVSGSTSTAGAHTHSISTLFGGTTSSESAHSHPLSLPDFSGGGLSFDPVFLFNPRTSNSSSHTHSYNALATNTNSGGSHSHNYVEHTAFQTWTDSDLLLFLSGQEILLSPVGSDSNRTSATGNHTHTYGLGATSGPAGTHNHVYTDRWETTTIFTYDVGIPPDGDYTRNGLVDQDDYDYWVDHFGSTTDLLADGNGNSVVDAADYTVWRDNLGASIGAGSVSNLNNTVPEPLSITLAILLATAGLVVCRWRR